MRCKPLRFVLPLLAGFLLSCASPSQSEDAGTSDDGSRSADDGTTDAWMTACTERQLIECDEDCATTAFSDLTPTQPGGMIAVDGDVFVTVDSTLHRVAANGQTLLSLIFNATNVLSGTIGEAGVYGVFADGSSRGLELLPWAYLVPDNPTIGEPITIFDTGVSNGPSDEPALAVAGELVAMSFAGVVLEQEERTYPHVLGFPASNAMPETLYAGPDTTYVPPVFQIAGDIGWFEPDGAEFVLATRGGDAPPVRLSAEDEPVGAHGESDRLFVRTVGELLVYDDPAACSTPCEPTQRLALPAGVRGLTIDDDLLAWRSDDAVGAMSLSCPSQRIELSAAGVRDVDLADSTMFWLADDGASQLPLRP